MMWDTLFDRLHEAVPDLSDKACLRSWRCGTCVECQERYGMVSIFSPTFDRTRDGAWHYELEFDGTPRVLSGRVARATGRTDAESFDNLLRALA